MDERKIQAGDKVRGKSSKLLGAGYVQSVDYERGRVLVTFKSIGYPVDYQLDFVELWDQERENMKAQIQAEVDAMLKRLGELKEQGLVGAWAVVVATPANEEGSRDLGSSACCTGHMYDFLSPEVMASSPFPGAQEYQAEKLDGLAQEVFDQMMADMPVEYRAFRDTFIPPSTN
jgi:hypothetical protein